MFRASASDSRWYADQSSDDALRDLRNAALAQTRSRHLIDVPDDTELEQAQRLEGIGTFAAGLAHDFANVLTSIGGGAHLLCADLPETDPRHRDLADILDQVDRANILVKQLLWLGKPQILNRQPIDLNDVIVDLESVFRRLAGSAVEFWADLDEAPCRIVADRPQIEQMICNLALNARDAIAAGGRATFTTRNVQRGGANAVTLTVRDNGVGMDSGTRDMIFEPFFTTKEPALGRGLGLSLVWTVLVQNHGTIEVDTQRGEGTTFNITFPSAPPQSRPR
jgi:signal transduction histidine kinase